MMSILTTFLFGLSVLSVVNAGVYISYTNNTGTYNIVREDAPTHLTANNHNAGEVWINGVNVNHKQDGTSAQIKSNESNIVDVPTVVNNVNINNYSRGKFRAEKRTTYNGAELTPSMPKKPDVTPPGTNDPNDTCCYISQPRKCSNNSNNVHTCETKIVQACGKRCLEPMENEEVYFKEGLENLPSKVPANKRPTYSTRQHPYQHLPFNYGNYPGNRFEIAQKRERLYSRAQPLQGYRRKYLNRNSHHNRRYQ